MKIRKLRRKKCYSTGPRLNLSGKVGSLPNTRIKHTSLSRFRKVL